MNVFIFALGAIIGVTLDRLVVWDKARAVDEERRYNAKKIQNLENELHRANAERFAMRREQQTAEPQPIRSIYTNPNFEQEFLQNGRAKTRIIPRGQAQPTDKGAR